MRRLRSSKDLQLFADIQARGGLIQQQQPGVLGQGPGDHHPLALPAGDLGNQPLLQVVGGGVAHGFQGPQQVVVRQGLQPLAVGIAPHEDDLQAGEGKTHLAGLKHHRPQLGPAAAAQALQRAAPHQEAPAPGRQQAGEGVNQSGFAAAVGAQEAHEFSGAHLEIEAAQDRSLAITHAEFFYLNHHIPLACRDFSR